MSRAIEKSPLLELLNERKAWEAPGPYKYPVIGPTLQQRIDEAVRCVTTLHSSDPFIGRRVKLYLSRGYCLPSEVLKDCRNGVSQRAREPKGDTALNLHAAKRRLEEAKRKADADKAWNQHRAKQYLEEHSK